MSRFIHAKYMPPNLRIGTLILGVLCWREWDLPSGLGGVLLTLWALIAACELFRLFKQDAGHPALHGEERA